MPTAQDRPARLEPAAVVRAAWEADAPRRVAAAAAPLVLALALAPSRGSLDIAAVVLGFTLLVVAVAATGDRLAGLIAAPSSAAWLDFFLIPPYLTFRIANGEDVVLALLLAAVGLAVTELALVGRRRAAGSARRAGYVDGVLQVLRIDATIAHGAARREAICAEITRVLGLDGCSYEEGDPAGGWPVLDDDGTVRHLGRPLDLARDGLPAHTITAIPVLRGGATVGHFRLVAASRLVYPSPDQLKVAVLLADQA